MTTNTDAPLYLRHLDNARMALGALSQQVIDDLADRLRHSGAAMALSDDRAQFQALMDALLRRRPELVQSLAEAMRQRIDEAHSGVSARRPLREASLTELSLLDDAQVNADIEVARLIAAVDEHAQSPLRELHGYTATLRQEPRLPRDANPLRPAVFAQALLQAIDGLALAPRARAVLLQFGGPALGMGLRAYYSEANEALRATGLKPHSAGYNPSERNSLPSEVDVTRPGALYGLLDRLTNPAPAAPLNNAARAAPQPLTLRDASGGTAKPAEPLRPSAGLAPQRVRDLLHMLFAQIVADPRLPPTFIRLLTQLEATLERLALTDAQFLYTDQHPAWQWLNRAASAALAYAEPGDGRAEALREYLAPTVARIAQVGNPDAGLFNAALTRLNQFLTELTQTELSLMAPSVARLQGVERRDELLPLVREQLQHQLNQADSPPALNATLRRFVIEIWGHVLATSMAQDGPDSDAAQAYTAAVDDLLWTLQPVRSEAHRHQFRARLPGLVKCLQQGMALIAWSDAQQQALLDELMNAHSAALRGQPSAASAAAAITSATTASARAPAAAPLSALERLLQEGDRERAAAAAAAESGSAAGPEWQNTDIGLDSGVGDLPTVPMGMASERGESAPQGDPWLAQLTAGTWCKLFVRGRWTTAQLIWRSEKDQFSLFSSPGGNRPHALTRSALARLRAEGLATALEDRNLVQRAVDGIVLALDNAPSPKT